MEGAEERKKEGGGGGENDGPFFLFAVLGPPSLSLLSLSPRNKTIKTHSVRKSFQVSGSLSLPALATPVRCSFSSCLTCFFFRGRF